MYRVSCIVIVRCSNVVNKCFKSIYFYLFYLYIFSIFPIISKDSSPSVKILSSQRWIRTALRPTSAGGLPGGIFPRRDFSGVKPSLKKIRRKNTAPKKIPTTKNSALKKIPALNLFPALWKTRITPSLPPLS